MRKPGKKHNQIDVRLQCDTPKKKLRLFYYLLNIFSFGTLKFMKTCPVTRFLGIFAQTFIRFSWEILPGLGFVLTAHPYLLPPPPPSIFKPTRKIYCWKVGSRSIDSFKKALSYWKIIQYLITCPITRVLQIVWSLKRAKMGGGGH